MAGRIIIKGEVWYGPRQTAEPDLEYAEILRSPEKSLQFAQAIPADSAKSRFRAGVPYYDQLEQIEYRVVSPHVFERDVTWQPSGFWVERWKVYPATFLDLVRRGWLDAAISEGSQERQYRCRDEKVVVDWVEARRAKQAQNVVDKQRRMEARYARNGRK